MAAGETDKDFINLKAVQGKADEWLRTGNPKNKDNILGLLSPGHLPMTVRIDKVFGKNCAFINIALSTPVRFERVVIHGAQSRTLVRCLPFLMEYSQFHASDHKVGNQPKMFSNDDKDKTLVTIYVKSQKSQDLPVGARLVRSLSEAIPEVMPGNIFYMITDIGDFTAGAPADIKDSSSAGAYGFARLFASLRQYRFTGCVAFPWNIPNQKSFAAVLDTVYEASLETEIMGANGNLIKIPPYKVSLSYYAHPHLASDQFWIVIHCGYEPINNPRVTEVVTLSPVEMNEARLKHLTRTTINLPVHQLVINTGVNPSTPLFGLYSGAAYCAAVAVNNQGKSETRKQQRGAMASSADSTTSRLYREKVAREHPGAVPPTSTPPPSSSTPMDETPTGSRPGKRPARDDNNNAASDGDEGPEMDE
jgi:hypothetical protein